MSQAEKNISTDNVSATEEDLTYGDIVWGQLRKNNYAMIALYLLIGLFLLAMFCPVIASDRPFIWTEDGVTSYPWFSSLFDRNYFENAVDIFFNLALVALFPMLGIWFASYFFIQKQNLQKRPRRRKLMRVGIGLIVLFLGSYIAILTFPHEEPYRQYYEDYQTVQEEGTDNISAVFAPIPYGYRKTGFKALEKPSGKHCQ